MQLEAKHVSFRYSRKENWILKNVSFTVESGERVGIVAPSGYGKSTLSLLLAGYLHPTEGEILLDGAPLFQKGPCPVQLIYQHPEKAVNPRWRMKKVLQEAGVKEEEALSSFGIERAWLERYPRELSGGELQRFCVARSLVAGLSVLICDEITTMLDAITQAQIWNTLLQKAEQRGFSIVAVTHNGALANQICTRIFDLEHGKNL